MRKLEIGSRGGFITVVVAFVVLRSIFAVDQAPASVLVEGLTVANANFKNTEVWRKEKSEVLKQWIETLNGPKEVPYCRLITYRQIRNSKVVGIAVVPAWHDGDDPVYKIWGRQGGKKYHALRFQLEGGSAWTKPFAGVDLNLMPKIWHSAGFQELAGFEAQAYDEKTLRVVASQFYSDPQFIKRIPRPPQTPAPVAVTRQYRHG